MNTHTRTTVQKGVLLTAIAAVAVYVAGDALSAALYDGYSFLDQAISELSAFGSPVRPLMVTVILIHNALLLAFGIGVLQISHQRSVRWIGILQIADFILVGIATHTFWAMSSRGMPAGFNDTMHIALSGVFSLLVVAMMILSAIAYPGWFRYYAIATIIVVVGFGIASSFAMRGIDQNDTPWAGGFERINAYAYFAWLVLLAVKACAPTDSTARSDARPAGAGTGRGGLSP
ncbi:DUF998 domain-containing protein [Lentzea aerocolonigenes]|uniref:DUF998 domain-containing protein n=1 Tax=Lentzea aerocolonigenes TaxID=68170 RepID=UPI0004C2C17A|nr:DUF998 domain-containing protein [Lentzea aerocolonigenes]MCP2242833.1 putative membrane protein [Lentzea aerocolonigenes]